MNDTLSPTASEELERTISVTLAGETREVTIKRYTSKHCWYAEVPVVCKFRTGNKLHTSHRPQIFERSKQSGVRFGRGDYFFGTEVIRNRHARVIAWADIRGGNSGWTANNVK